MAAVMQLTWRWKIAAYLFAAGMGAGAFLVGMAAAFMKFDEAAQICTAVGPPTAALSTVFLIWDLGRPEKFMLALLHPRSSWISRGFCVLLGFLVFGSLTVAHTSRIGFVFAGPPAVTAVIDALATLCALAACLYTGVLVGVLVCRPFWNSALLPLLFLISALSSGVALATVAGLLAERWGGISDSTAAFFRSAAIADVSLLLLELLMIYLYVSITSVRAPEATRLLLRGALAPLFWGGLVISGLIAPAALEVFAGTRSNGPGRDLTTCAASLLLLLGGFLMRLLFLAAGIRSPLFARVPFRVRPTV